MIVPVPRDTMPGAAARASMVGRDDLHVQQLGRFIRRKLHERHVVRDAGVVDQHRDGLCRAHVGDRLHTGVGTEVGDHGTHLDVGKRSHELLEPIATPPHRHEVVAFGAESERESATDAGGGPGNECQPTHDRSPRFGAQVGRCLMFDPHSFQAESRRWQNAMRIIFVALSLSAQEGGAKAPIASRPRRPAVLLPPGARATLP